MPMAFDNFMGKGRGLGMETKLAGHKHCIAEEMREPGEPDRTGDPTTPNPECTFVPRTPRVFLWSALE